MQIEFPVYRIPGLVGASNFILPAVLFEILARFLVGFGAGPTLVRYTTSMRTLQYAKGDTIVFCKKVHCTHQGTTNFQLREYKREPSHAIFHRQDVDVHLKTRLVWYVPGTVPYCYCGILRSDPERRHGDPDDETSSPTNRSKQAF